MAKALMRPNAVEGARGARAEKRKRVIDSV